MGHVLEARRQGSQSICLRNFRLVLGLGLGLRLRFGFGFGFGSGYGFGFGFGPGFGITNRHAWWMVHDCCSVGPAGRRRDSITMSTSTLVSACGKTGRSLLLVGPACEHDESHVRDAYLWHMHLYFVGTRQVERERTKRERRFKGRQF